MSRTAPAHFFVDVSAHGFGHLAQVAPVLNALLGRLPQLRLTIRSGLPADRLQARIMASFRHLPESSDFGYVMHDAVRVDREATAHAYRRQHADWEGLVERDARLLRELKPDLVLSDVAYLPLAGAARAGIPSMAMCSLNWAELFAHFYARQDWAAPIHRQMLAAYQGAECFLRLTPAMTMADLPRRRRVGPVAALGRRRSLALRRQLGCADDERLVLIAFGGVNKQLPIEKWPAIAGVRWLIPQAWRVTHARTRDFEPLGWPMIDLFCSVDAVITKPGYGAFVEAACNGVPIIYLRRHEWPEQDFLIDWLKKHAQCREISDSDLIAGELQATLAALWAQTAPPPPEATGAAEAAAIVLPRLIAAGA